LLSITSCSQIETQSEEIETTQTGIVVKIGLSSGKYQDFIITIKDFNNQLHEERAKEITFNIGDTMNYTLAKD